MRDESGNSITYKQEAGWAWFWRDYARVTAKQFH